MSAGVKIKKNAWPKVESRLLSINGLLRGYLQNEIYPAVQGQYFEMFKTEGASENLDWRAIKISQEWVDKKVDLREKDAQRYPGGDRRGIFTGKLLGAVVGKADSSVAGAKEGAAYHRKIVGSNKLIISTTLPYYDDQPYPIGLSKETVSDLKGFIKKFIKEKAGSK
jgi:hypothetical protein